MKNKKKNVSILILACLIGALLLFTSKYLFTLIKVHMNVYENKAEAMEEDHWVYDDSGRKFVFHDGVVIRNTWREVDGVRYYFDENGYVKSGWVSDKGTRYFLSENGSPATGWIQDGETWYYLDENGIPKNGWIQDGSNWFYMNADGSMATGWIDVNNTDYYLKENGAMATGWVKDGDLFYYLDQNGTVCKGWKEVNGEFYYLSDDDGSMITGWINDDGAYYFLEDNGKMARNTWKEKEGVRYFLGSNGKPASGWVTKDGKKFLLNDNGTLASSGWVKSGDKWYYLEKDGTPKTGWLKDGKSWYYLNNDGTMATGWVTVDGKSYFMGPNGKWDGKAAKKAALGSGPMVAITFDDGPGPYTDRILNTLQANGARATFFMLGQNVPRYPEALRKMEQLGCELANHSYDHPSLTSLIGDGVRNQIESTNNNIRAIVGHDAYLVRPPYGAYNSSTQAVLNNPFILWSVDTLDWKTRNAQSTYDSVMSAQDGDIILMHDIHAPTADAVDLFVPALREKGFQMVTVSELAAAKGINLQPGSAYGSFR